MPFAAGEHGRRRAAQSIISASDFAACRFASGPATLASCELRSAVPLQAAARARPTEDAEGCAGPHHSATVPMSQSIIMVLLPGARSTRPLPPFPLAKSQRQGWTKTK